MTTIQTRVGPWNVRPGWGIAVDLTPPQLVQARRVRTLRKLVAAGLGLVVLACGAGYVMAARQEAAAQDALSQVQLQTAQLHADLAKYDDTVQIQTTVSGVRQQISTVMTGDVAVDQLLAHIRAALPDGMSIQQASVTVSLASLTVGAPDTNGTTGLADPRHPRVGDISINGTSHKLADLAVFVDRLQLVPGVIDVVPTSNAAGKGSVQYTVTLGFTDQLQTHLYDVTQAGTK